MIVHKSKINKTQNTLIKWDNQSSEELVLTRKIVVLQQSVVWDLKF